MAATFCNETEVLNFSNGNQLDKVQIANLAGNWTPDEVKEDMIENIDQFEAEGWDIEQIYEFYNFLINA